MTKQRLLGLVAVLASGFAVGFVRAPDAVAANRDPVCTGAAASPSVLWPPNHKFHRIRIVGVTDPDGDPVTIRVTHVTQDEPVDGRGDGNTSPDAVISDGGRRVKVRAERSGLGDGRIYTVYFTATDDEGGDCSHWVKVVVPHDQGRRAFDSTRRARGR
jgi:hypothetical protein